MEKPGALSWLDFLQQDRGQQRTPKDGPIIVGIMHFFSLQRNGWVLIWSAKLRQEKPERVANWGEQRTTETALPLGHDQQKLPSRFQRRQPLITSRLEGIDTATSAMASRVGIVLQDHLAGFIERE